MPSTCLCFLSIHLSTYLSIHSQEEIAAGVLAVVDPVADLKARNPATRDALEHCSQALQLRSTLHCLRCVAERWGSAGGEAARWGGTCTRDHTHAKPHIQQVPAILDGRWHITISTKQRFANLVSPIPFFSARLEPRVCMPA